MSGQLSTSGSFNYEAENAFVLKITAVKENGKVSGDNTPATVNVNIQEETDVPKFEKESYDIEVDEDLALSATVGSGFVIQDDDTNSDQFDCSMVNIQTLDALDTFNIVQQGDACKLVTLRSLDYSHTPVFR